MFLLLNLLVIALLVVGCGNSATGGNNTQSQNTQTQNTQSQNTQTENTQANQGSSSEQSANVEIPKRVLSVGSASAGSLYVTYTSAWANMLMQKINGLNMTVEPGGSSQNIQGIDAGSMDFGITATLQAYPAYHGTGWAEGKKYQNVAGLFPAYSYEGVWFTTANKKIESIEDLNGKVVALGYAGGGSDFTGREIIEFFGIKPKQIVNASWEDTGGMLKDGLVDAIFYLAGHPAGFIEELQLQHDLKFIPIGEANLQKFKEAFPHYAIGTLKAGIYEDLTEDYLALQGWNFIAASPELPEDFIYLITKTTWENVTEIHNAHSSFVQTALENVKNINIPLHPGAIKYYEEMGAELPNN